MTQRRKVPRRQLTSVRQRVANGFRKIPNILNMRMSEYFRSAIIDDDIEYQKQVIEKYGGWQVHTFINYAAIDGVHSLHFKDFTYLADIERRGDINHFHMLLEMFTQARKARAA